MKASDLMIGCWVHFNAVAGMLSKDRDAQVTGILEDCIAIGERGTDIFNEDYYTPITLTEEILNANHLQLGKNEIASIREFPGCADKATIIITRKQIDMGRHHPPKVTYNVFISNRETSLYDGGIFNIKLQSVHQLQIALHQAGLIYMAKNFKLE